ncbi:MAG: type II secretion system protein [Deferribacterales bacterium]
MNKKGFTLIEVIIVLFIVGFLTAASIKAIQTTVSSSKISSSTDKVSALVREVGEYSARAKRLPNTSANFQITTGNEIYSAVTSRTDSFGKPMLYIPDNDLTEVDENGRPKDICAINSTTMSVQICSSSACTTPDKTISNVAFAAVSGGSNQNVQITYDTNSRTLKTYLDTISVDGYTADQSKTETYDDIAKWMTLDELKKAAGCDGAALEIIQKDVPPLAHRNDYSYTLTLKGGVGPYQWCAESDSSDVRSLLNYKISGGSNKSLNSISACGESDYVTGDSLIINTSSAPVISDDAPASAKVKVYVKDSNGVKAEKQYSLSILKSYNLALAAKDASSGGNADREIEGFSQFHSFVKDYPEFKSVIDMTDDKIAFHKSPLVLLSHKYGCTGLCWMTSVSAFFSCNIPTADTNRCLSFTKGKLAAFFKLTPKFEDLFAMPYGFTFTIIKSYRYSGDTMVSTLNDVGAGFEGLGYSDYEVSGILGLFNDSASLYGDNFALEFDMPFNYGLLYPNAKSDPSDTSHMALVSHKNGSSYNTHNSLYNDSCTKNTNTNGCYKSTGEYTGSGFNRTEVPVIIEKTPFYVRMEAVSGCNASGTVCDGTTTIATDPHDYVCAYAWQIDEDDYNGYTADASGVKKINDVKSFYMFDKITKGTALPSDVGTPILKNCYRDNIAGRTLDSVRYGFTIGTRTILSGQFDISFTNFKLNIQDY